MKEASLVYSNLENVHNCHKTVNHVYSITSLTQQVYKMAMAESA